MVEEADVEDEPGGDGVSYDLDDCDQQIVASAVQLLFKVHGSALPGERHRGVLARIGQVLAAMPDVSDPLVASIALTGPRRRFGPHEIYHWWEISIEEHAIIVTSGGHFYRKSTGGDTFTSMRWFAIPGAVPEFDDYLDSLRIVDDAAPFPEEVTRLILTEPGYSLRVTERGEELLGDDVESEGAGAPHEVGTPESEVDSHDSSVWDAALEKYVDLERAEVEECTCGMAPEACDMCGHSLVQARFFVDGRLPRSGEWAYLCTKCAHHLGVQIGWGKGQLFARKASWLLVGGFAPPESSESD